MTSEKESGSEPMRVDRRTTIKWLAAAMATAHAGCTKGKYLGDEIPAAQGQFLGTAAQPATTGYGTDIDRMNPVVPWPRTMTEAQLRAAGALCDLIIPADERSPAASAVGVPDFIDEWVSAPYAAQQEDREVILGGLEWLEQQSREQFDSGFVDMPDPERTELIDRIAYADGASPELAGQVEFFQRFRFLTVGAFYTTEEGMKDVGYTGNVAIHGEYPGPSDEAMAHLSGVLGQLGLELPA